MDIAYSLSSLFVKTPSNLAKKTHSLQAKSSGLQEVACDLPSQNLQFSGGEMATTHETENQI